MLRGKSRARIGRAVQRYFPQCVACCSKQAGAVRSGATRLVLHYYGMRPWYYAGEGRCSCSALAAQKGLIRLLGLECIAAAECMCLT